MPSILVIEHEGRYIERIQDALSSEGWKTRFVAGRPEALRAAASEQPDLVLINSDLPGAAEMLRTFATHQGGPGAVALIPEHQAPVAPAEMGADEVVAKPFTDQQLRLVVRRGLNRPHGDAAGAAATAGPPSTATPGDAEEPKLTSEDIFGDLLQEVDSAPVDAAGEPAAAAAGDEGRAAAPPSPPKPAPPTATEPAARPAAEPAARPTAKAPRPDSRLGSDDPEIAKRLEMTLSGVLEEPKAGGDRSRAAAGAPKAPPAEPGPPAGAEKAPATETSRRRKPRRSSDDVDELLNLTLSSLEEPTTRKVKKRRKRAEDVDLSEIAALAGGRRKPASRPQPAAEAETPADSLEPPPLPGAADLEVPEELDLDAADGDAPDLAAPDLDLPDLEAPNLETPDLETPEVEVAPPEPAPADPDAFDDETFDEVFDASWGEALPTDEGSYEVQPPDDFEPRGLAGDGGTATGTGTGTATGTESATGTATLTETDAADQTDVTPQAAAVESTPDDGERFGHYHLLDRIAIGGMAEVWKARMSGVEGFQKTVAIKKILPQMTDNKDFVSMFIDEAKLAAQLNHPNITHIYDLGKIERDYYIAMEYVEGRNLRDVLNQARRKGKALPVGLALVIAARLASGLDYAHRKRDFDDRELELVHRDVSPQNVLLSYEGDIKLCDFGIVKAVTKATHTQMGALKGKLQYMSPEQAWGRTVDSRSDIFSLGVLLFEMLTGERLFAGDNEISVLESVRECHVRSPEELNPGLPEGVEEIVLRALAKEPDDRYDNAGEMQGELEAILYRLKPTPTQADLGTWLRQLDEAEDLDDEARQRFTWNTGAALAATTGRKAGASGDAEASDVRPDGDGVASPFGLDPGDVGATQPVRLTDLAANAEGGAAEGAGAGTGAPTTAPSAKSGDAGTATGTGVGLPPAGDAVDGEAVDGEAVDGEAVDDETADTTFGEGSFTAMAPPEGEEVTPEEGGRRGLWILVAAILLLIVLGAVWFYGAPDGDPAPGEEPVPAATEPAEAEPAAGEAGAAAPGDGTAAPTEGAEGGDGETVDLEAMLDEQLAAQEEKIETAVRENREPELERLRAELRRLREREAKALAEAAAAEAAAAERGGAGSEGGQGGGDGGEEAGAGDG